MTLKLSWGLVALCLVSTGVCAASENLLPLERGAYAPETTACPQRSRAEIMTFWGDRLNQSSADCAIGGVQRGGSVRLNSDLGLDKWIFCRFQAAAGCGSRS